MSQVPPPRPGSKTERAYQTIRDRIVEGTYGPGYRLVLDHVARELVISPVPVREAIRRLEAEGYVEFTRNVGAQVARIDSAEYGSILRALAVLEGAATATSAPHLTSEDLRRAHAVNDGIRESLEQFDPDGFTRRNNAFHELLYARCPNPYLRALMEREWGRLSLVRRATFSPVPGLAARSVADHERILQLIASGAPEHQIERAAREHKLSMQDAAEYRRRSAEPAGQPEGSSP